jgi:hypothetical protein
MIIMMMKEGRDGCGGRKGARDGRGGGNDINYLKKHCDDKQ